MQKKYSDDIVAITLNIDHDEEDAAPTAEIKKKVLDKLLEKNIGVFNVMSSEPFGDVLDRHQLFSLPAALVYDRDGKLHKKFEGDVSFENQVDPFIAEMLKTAGKTSKD